MAGTDYLAPAAIGTTVQAYDAGLQSISGLTTAADRTIYTPASDTYAVTTLTAFGRSLIDDADAATARTTIGVVIGTDVQAYDTDLAALAAISTTGMLSRTGAGTATTRTITASTGIVVSNGDGVSGNPTVSADLASQAEAEAGTDNTKLITPLRSAQSQAVRLLTSGSISASAAALDIVLSSYSGYTNFQFVFTNMIFTANSALRMRISTDGGSSFITTAVYRSFSANILAGSTAVSSNSNTNASTDFAVSANPIGTTLAKSARGQINFSTASQFGVDATVFNEFASGIDGIMTFSFGTYQTTGVNAVRFFPSSTTFASGSWALYGVRR